MFLATQMQGFSHTHEVLQFRESFEAAFSGEIPSGWSRTLSATQITVDRSSTWATDQTYSMRATFSEASSSQRQENFERTYDLTRVARIHADFRFDYWNNHGANIPMTNAKVSVSGGGETGLRSTTADGNSAYSSVREWRGRSGQSAVPAETTGLRDLNVRGVTGNTTVTINRTARDCNSRCYIDNIRFIG